MSSQPDIEEGPKPPASDEKEVIDPDKGLTSEEHRARLEQYGPNEIPAHVTPLYVLFLRQFTGFLPLLIELAAIISLAVQDYVDFAIIISIVLVNACLGFREEYHAKKALEEVAGSVESEIAVRRDGEVKSVLTKDLVPGDIVLLVGGTIVPADTKWVRGDRMSIDTAALTGEPLPRKYPSDDYGDVILNGSTVVAGECYGQVLKTGVNTEIGKAQADILKDKSVRVISVFQRKMMLVVQALVAMSLAVVVAVLLVEGLVYDGFDDQIKQTILDALSILIASIPVALPLVLQVNLALGASFLAKKHHAIVTSIPALQDIASMSMLCSDKTGTLTTANMSVILDRIVPADGFDKNDVIRMAYLCSNADKKDDPIDRAVVRAYEEAALEQTAFRQTQIIGFNPTVKRVVAFVTDGSKTLTIAKGLPAKIMNTEYGGADDHECQWKVERYNDKAFIKRMNEHDKTLSTAGYKTIAIAMCEGDGREDDHGPWKLVGLLPMLDPPREDTRATIASLHHANISVKMITGDHVNVGKETARLIGLGTAIHAGEEIRSQSNQQMKNQMIWDADGFASVLPSDKREVVLTLRNEFGIVTGMTGDGVNDAPALSAAQVGIAVEGATDAAQHAADLILTQPGLTPIYGAVLESRRIFARIKAYVVYRVAASIMLVLCLSIILFASGCAVNSLYIIILALFNDISMIPVAYDNAKATTKPQLPNARKLVTVSLYYGFVHTAAALAFIFSMAHSNHLNNPITLDTTCDHETQGFIWIYLVLVTEFAIFSVRAPSYFWTSMPSIYLLGSVFGTCIGCCFIALYARSLSGENLVWIILFNLGMFVLVDIGKVWFRELIHDAPGDVIESDELLKVEEVPKTETVLHMEKTSRYAVHRQSQVDPSDLQHTIEFQRHGLLGVLADINTISFSDGFIRDYRRQTYYTTMGAPTRTKAFSAPALNW